jgi:hypothetical protein
MDSQAKVLLIVLGVGALAGLPFIMKMTQGSVELEPHTEAFCAVVSRIPIGEDVDDIRAIEPYFGAQGGDRFTNAQKFYNTWLRPGMATISSFDLDSIRFEDDKMSAAVRFRIEAKIGAQRKRSNIDTYWNRIGDTWYME